VNEKAAAEITPEVAATTGMVIAYHAQEAPDRMAVTTIYGERTFAELSACVNQLARVFRGAGLVPGDGVAALLKNRCEFIEVYCAPMRMHPQIR